MRRERVRCGALSHSLLRFSGARRFLWLSEGTIAPLRSGDGQDWDGARTPASTGSVLRVAALGGGAVLSRGRRSAMAFRRTT